ncbi:MAG: hypothetical protein FJ242_10360 [Nitrospira sp.]|nr:hypothetical protein [Nitrospira sp.]
MAAAGKPKWGWYKTIRPDWEPAAPLKYKSLRWCMVYYFAHAVSHKGLDIRAIRSVIKPIGHGMEPKIFWGIKRYQGLIGKRAVVFL